MSLVSDRQRFVILYEYLRNMDAWGKLNYKGRQLLDEFKDDFDLVAVSEEKVPDEVIFDRVKSWEEPYRVHTS